MDHLKLQGAFKCAGCKQGFTSSLELHAHRESCGVLGHVHTWAHTIFGRRSARYEWIMAAAAAELEGKPTPVAPGRWMPGKPERTLETMRRIISGEPGGNLRPSAGHKRA